MMKIDAASVARNVKESLVSWDWTKRLLYWIVLSAGTMAECAFLIASLWVTINASVHGFVLVFMPEELTVRLSQLATVAYVGLPECILALAIVTTVAHIRTYAYNRNDKRALMWSILYGLPTIVFLVLSLITIGCSMLSINFQLPAFMIVTRGLSGYLYGLIALLYSQLGIPQESDRLQEKDAFIAELQTNTMRTVEELKANNERMLAETRDQKDGMIAQLRIQVDGQNDEIENLKERLLQYQNTERELINAMHKSSEDALQAYSDECKEWLNSGVKTVSLEEIMRYTGHTKRKIEYAINKGMLQTASRNKELILISSLTKWLKDNPPSAQQEERVTAPLLRVIGG